MFLGSTQEENKLTSRHNIPQMCLESTQEENKLTSRIKVACHLPSHQRTKMKMGT